MNRRPHTTLRDVATRVGCSVNTASFVLNGNRSETRVSTRTRDAIWAAANDLGYVPNEVARSLQSRRTNTLGFFTDFEFLYPSNLFLADLMGGVQEACAEHRLDVLLHTVRPSSLDALAPMLSDRRVDGLVLYAPPGNELAQRLSLAGLPLVAIVDQVRGIPSVVVDDAHGGRLQAEYLRRRGHRKVLYRAYRAMPASAVCRMEGFFEAASRLGLEVTSGRPFDDHTDWSLSDADWRALDLGITAIVCWEDNSAHGTAAVLAEAGRSVEVVGFNGQRTRIPERFDLPTVVAPWREVARAAVRHLIRLIEGQIVPDVTTLPVAFDRPMPGESSFPMPEPL